jgi:isopenicillin N synthase-like dioxygenase
VAIVEPVDLDLRPVAAESGIVQSVPLIDIGPLIEGSVPVDVRRVAGEIATACREWGFFQIVNHGISRELQDDVWRQMQHFFALPLADKEVVLRSRENPWGYYNNELTKNQRDRKEVFDYTTDGADAIYRAHNRWPSTPAHFRPQMSKWLDASTEVSLKLLEAFCIGLDLPAHYLAPSFTPQHTGFVRLNHYPVEDPLAGKLQAELPPADLGVHHHTDAGALTILLQDRVGGLQVYHQDFWHDVRPEDGAMVVNTGDMMQVWSNDIYRAAIHRVIAMQQEDRFSIPFFFNPAAGTTVEPLPTTVTSDRPRRYRAIDWAEFRGQRTDGDYADYGPEIQISQYRC